MKCGIFVSHGALRDDGKGWVLSDESDDPRITVPICHVFSAEDPLSWMSYDLSETCQEEGKIHIMHDKGHVIPHTEEFLTEVASAISQIILTPYPIR